TGCFLIGIISHLLESQAGMTAEMRLLLMVGLLGSFTTYSTFSYETMNLLQDQRFFLVLINIGTHIFLGLLAVLTGRFTIITIWR
ncbi:MAG: CrcB family protein, partial [Deltaproteobacteria bacterium]|nr:CrcB family protein [Deltaproteobacteria bacterium]MBW2661128.1 CrcB family protein [Deltaproteobacteria bacterium]